MKPEEKVQTQIIKLLTKIKNEIDPGHFEFFRRQAGGFNYKNGLPDLFFIWDGVHVEIECKGIGGCPSSEQLVWEKRLVGCGCKYWRDENFESFERFMELGFPKYKNWKRG